MKGFTWAGATTAALACLLLVCCGGSPQQTTKFTPPPPPTAPPAPPSQGWTWVAGGVVGVGGAFIPPPVYGARGVPSPANDPGGRIPDCTWRDAAGDLWLFGGRVSARRTDNGYLNDLWVYDPAAGEWTWIGGSDQANQPGIYGSMGQAAAANWPGGRYWSACWTDKSGNFWLFGGMGVDDGSAAPMGDLNDLWRYQPGTGEWAWMSGYETSESYPNADPPHYGTLGVPSAANFPGPRWTPTAWADGQGDLWLFGGMGIDASGRLYSAEPMNDLWRYNIASGEWTWMNGSAFHNQNGRYGTQGWRPRTTFLGAAPAPPAGRTPPGICGCSAALAPTKTTCSAIRPRAG